MGSEMELEELWWPLCTESDYHEYIYNKLLAWSVDCGIGIYSLPSSRRGVTPLRCVSYTERQPEALAEHQGSSSCSHAGVNCRTQKQWRVSLLCTRSLDEMCLAMPFLYFHD